MAGSSFFECLIVTSFIIRQREENMTIEQMAEQLGVSKRYCVQSAVRKRKNWKRDKRARACACRKRRTKK